MAKPRHTPFTACFPSDLLPPTPVLSRDVTQLSSVPTMLLNMHMNAAAPQTASKGNQFC